MKVRHYAEIRTAQLFLKCRVTYDEGRTVTVDSMGGWVRVLATGNGNYRDVTVLVNTEGMVFAGDGGAVDGEGWGVK